MFQGIRSRPSVVKYTVLKRLKIKKKNSKETTSVFIHCTIYERRGGRAGVVPVRDQPRAAESGKSSLCVDAATSAAGGGDGGGGGGGGGGSQVVPKESAEDRKVARGPSPTGKPAWKKKRGCGRLSRQKAY